MRPDDRIRAIFEAALNAVDAEAAVRRDLGALIDETPSAPLRLADFNRIVVVAIGKAAPGMARGAANVLDGRIDEGFILTKEGMLGEACPAGFRCFEAGHPIPDQRGVAASREILRAVRALRRNDLLLALISGGGSALFESPVDSVSLVDIQQTTRLLLHAGAPIEALNTVRSVVSEVKGGGLRRAAGEATVASLILSDVLGNDPTVIASGPTIPAAPDHRGAAEVLRRYGVIDRVPAAVSAVIDAGPQDLQSPMDSSHDVWRIVADNGTLVHAAERAALDQGLRTKVIWHEQEGEASDLARAFVAACDATPEDVGVVLGGGEATVTVRGDGAGGRNTEFALAAAIALEQASSPWHVASLASDGDDADTGAAGAIASGETVARARSLGIDPGRELANNNSAHVFGAAGGLVKTGPTGTNVNDLYIGVRGG